MFIVSSLNIYKKKVITNMESSEFTFDQKYWKKIGQSKNTIVSNILFSREEKG